MKRTGFAPRTKPMARCAMTPDVAKLAIKEKKRKCAVKTCRTPFKTFSSFVSWCSPDCGVVVGLQALGKQKRAAEKVDRIKTLARKEAIKTIPQLKAEAQKAFNAFIRERDRHAGHPCISSARALDWSGNNVDAGHYRSRGSADHLRFNEDNCHAQSKQDNRYGSGNAVDYRIGLIKRIGLERVEALEADQTIVKWTRDMLIGIRATYKRKLKELKAAA